MSAGREVLLPFCQVVRSPAKASIEIGLSGTIVGGEDNVDPLFCNYISIEPCRSHDNGDPAPAMGFYQVVPTGMRLSNHGYVNEDINPSSLTVSGLLGSRFKAAPADQTATTPGIYASGSPAGGAPGVLGGPTTLTSLSLNGPNMTSSVTIHNHFDTSCLMLVNYGVVQKSNIMRDGDHYIGS